jgi:1-acyl-sn-glycerol-3-phosphate acyltransferase
MFESLSASLINGAARAITGARAIWIGTTPSATQRIYFANHSSHVDFVLLWSSLPRRLRARTRPVAGADYWDKNRIRSYLIHRVFNGVLVDRQHDDPNANPIQPLLDALEQGDSLIIFPEGTRNQEEELLPFKSGIFRLAQAFPTVELVPVWMSNLKRVMPKGKVIPLPLLCTLNFGAPLQVAPDETKEEFLARCKHALLALAPETT